MNDQTAAKCPICSSDNRCGNVTGNPNACWCSKEYFPQEIFKLVPKDQIDVSCICKACLDKFKEASSV
ncbi:cysteine-rich CWC family protein [Paenibacillus sp. PR3]|uniref:Cysteine-rich CWC family protein n=1 Tax=Paenibacillus terricola TaxID=2763503 RepID=A0ABR8MU29_9BACL|nr:cysteine-rich CWC family protein [Paenibacillus terricola]MBD3919464.1 cysteine-rich CWC family protein [Paenibacillus terricola]